MSFAVPWCSTCRAVLGLPHSFGGSEPGINFCQRFVMFRDAQSPPWSPKKSETIQKTQKACWRVSNATSQAVVWISIQMQDLVGRLLILTLTRIKYASYRSVYFSSSALEGRTFLPWTESRPLRMHSLRPKPLNYKAPQALSKNHAEQANSRPVSSVPVPHTMTSYSSSIGLA